MSNNLKSKAIADPPFGDQLSHPAPVPRGGFLRLHGSQAAAYFKPIGLDGVVKEMPEVSGPDLAVEARCADAGAV
jgi:hypothetical protein